MKSMKNTAGALVAVALLSVALFADTGAAARYESGARMRCAKAGFEEASSRCEGECRRRHRNSSRRCRSVPAQAGCRRTGAQDRHVQHPQSGYGYADPDAGTRNSSRSWRPRLTYVRMEYDNTFRFLRTRSEEQHCRRKGPDRTASGTRGGACRDRQHACE